MAAESFRSTTNDVGDDIVIVIRHVVNFEILSDVFPKNIGDFDFWIVIFGYLGHPSKTHRRN